MYPDKGFHYSQRGMRPEHEKKRPMNGYHSLSVGFPLSHLYETAYGKHAK